jgi:hypothetical protein
VQNAKGEVIIYEKSELETLINEFDYEFIFIADQVKKIITTEELNRLGDKYEND